MKGTVIWPIGFISIGILMLIFQKRLVPILKVGGSRGMVIVLGTYLIVGGLVLLLT